ncbi:MAG: hypothetical protein K2N23_05025, partial [Clostridia bacterium]|nr:hypothetical protein [Clostridia bacterium]
AAACGNKHDRPSDDEKDKTVTKEDTQLLKNGNFEMFTIPEKKKDGNEPEYLIKTPENWTRGGTSSYTMSGIISTSEKAWEKMTADTLADVLDYNNKLDSSSSSYLSEFVDYNGMKSSDILYKNQFEALRSEDDLEEDEKTEDKLKERKETIYNPGTHYNVKKNESDGKLYCTTDDGEKEVFENEKGEYFLDKDFKEPISNVLMLHNYATSHNGIAQYYSSVEIELPANTAAEVSVWVKTSNLFFDQGKTVNQDRGANIAVTQTVGSSTLDKFMISCINTEKLIKEGAVKADYAKKYNNWVQYTVYVNACDFAATKIKLELGLGETGSLTEGYAFFDDVQVTKYISLDDSASFKANEDLLDNDNTCNLSSDASEKIFKADSYRRNDGDENTTDNDLYSKRNSEDFHYFIDLSSERLESSDERDSYYKPVSFNSGSTADGVITVSNLKTGFTVDSDNYVSARDYDGKLKGFNGVDETDKGKWRIPFKEPLVSDSDLLAYVTTGYEFKEGDTKYYEKLNNSLNGEKNSAANLPKNSKDNTNNMLVMLSAYGAAYTTSFELNVPREHYYIISFWVKTSDMDGSTAATVSIKSDDENIAKFNLDTTDKVTNIGDKDEEKNIFDGWVQCFFFVHNELEETDDKKNDTVTVEFSFGNTTIKGTDVRSFKNGWIALANMQILDVEEKIFAYTGSGDGTASLTITKEAEKKTHVFDDAYYNESTEIKNDMVKPSSYDGVNGGSSAIKNNGHVSIPFDEFTNNEYVDKNGNTQKFTGLINKEHFIEENSAYVGKDWYKPLYKTFLNVNDPSTIEALKAWNEIFGNDSVQPLIITNQKRDSYVSEKEATEANFDKYYIKDEETGGFIKADSVENAKFDEKETYYTLKQVINYGYIGDEKDVSANNYATISVRVKVSAGAVAYVYLVDTTANKNVLSFTAPTYSFYYDIDGNVLRDKPKDNASFKEQRENILYTLRDDGLYEDENGKLYANTWNYDKLYYTLDSKGNKVYKNGETYLEDENGKELNHYLVTTDGVKVYEFIDGNYYYIVSGKTQSAVITPFETQYARYSYNHDDENSENYMSEDYMVKIVGDDHLESGIPQWVTVTFVIHAGSNAKSYRLELWNGEREEAETATEGGIVIFDYSYTTISDDSAKSDYEKEIINAYLKELDEAGALNDVETTGMNIADYEKLADKKQTGVNINLYNYKAHYYTYSLYDSANFQPFNKEVASDGATGYDYSVSDQKETLAYLSVKDGNEYTIFADYSAIDKSISLNNPTEDDSNETPEETDNSSNGSVWLLASSIILVIALVFAIIAIFLKDVIKKMRHNKVTSKNNYDQRKTNRYKRKLHLKNEEIVEVDADENTDAVDAEEVTETEMVEDPAEEVEDTTEEAPVEEVNDVMEETPVEDVANDTLEEPSVEDVANDAAEETPAPVEE